MTPRLKPLADQVIVITGASSGIGLVTARMAAARGATVVVAARNEAALEKLSEEISSQGGRTLAVRCDVGPGGRGAAPAGCRGAGIRPGRHVGQQCWHLHLRDRVLGCFRWPTGVACFDTVLLGASVYGSLAAMRHFRATGQAGAIVNVGSFFGDRATPVQSTYASAKFAVHGFTDALRMELEHEALPISVSLIHPGRIDTPYNEHAGNYMPMQPVHRGMIYPPEAVAEAILWCASHPKRDMYVGFQAKAAAVIGAFAPRLTDMIMERIMYTSQQSRDRTASGSRSRALFQAGYGGQERGTHEPGLMRNRSLYVTATKRPMATAAALGVAGLVVRSAIRRRRA